MLGIVAVVIGLAWRVSPWFLLAFFLLFPAWNNAALFVAGLLRPLLFGRQHVDIVVEQDRVGQQVGATWHWVPLAEVDRVTRLGGVWAVLKFSDISIYLPASAVDPTCITHIQAKSRQPHPGGAK
jgi:hypothetical protein